MSNMVSFAVNGGTSEGYLAAPDGGGPAVIVIQEWWGLVPHVTSLVDRFAAAGFTAFAPDLYHGERTTEPDRARRLMMGLAMDQAAREIAGAAEYLAGQPGTGQRVGAVGFCMGGSLALWSATFSDRVVATVGFYPALPWERMNPEWTNYDRKSALMHCSEQDGTSAAAGIQAAHQAIKNAGGEAILQDYPGTRHAFFNDDRPESYDAPAAASAWARTLDFLRTRLG